MTSSESTITDEQIRLLKTEAASQGDDAQAHVCFVALGDREPGAGGQIWPTSRAQAIAECERAIRDAQAQDDGVPACQREGCCGRAAPDCHGYCRYHWGMVSDTSGT